MSTALLESENLPPRPAAPWRTPVREEVVAALARELFTALNRRDQRERAEQYLRGLLLVRGRKSIRNIASALGGSALEQSLHHFVSCSTWDWTAMRRALAEHVQHTLEPKAWVLRSMQIPKVGEHSVGVDRRFLPQLGKTVNGQQAYGLWLTSPRASAPVNWRLFLPPSWLEGTERRRRAEIPESHGEETLASCAASTALEVARWMLPPRPVVLDARDGELQGALDMFQAHGLPFVARISASDPLAVADTAMPGYGSGLLPARQIARSVSGLRRHCEWPDPVATVPMVRDTLVAGVRVTTATSPYRAWPAPADRRPLVLLGMWEEPHRPPTEFWLTDMASTPLPVLTRLARLARRAELDYAQTGEQAGLAEFAGRSYQGWHRHITLASAAHTAMTLSREPRH